MTGPYSQDECNNFLHNEGFFSKRAEHPFCFLLCGSGGSLELAQYLKQLYVTAESNVAILSNAYYSYICISICLDVMHM